MTPIWSSVARPISSCKLHKAAATQNVGNKSRCSPLTTLRMLSKCRQHGAAACSHTAEWQLFKTRMYTPCLYYLSLLPGHCFTMFSKVFQSLPMFYNVFRCFERQKIKNECRFIPNEEQTVEWTEAPWICFSFGKTSENLVKQRPFGTRLVVFVEIRQRQEVERKKRVVGGDKVIYFQCFSLSG